MKIEFSLDDAKVIRDNEERIAQARKLGGCEEYIACLEEVNQISRHTMGWPLWKKLGYSVLHTVPHFKLGMRLAKAHQEVQLRVMKQQIFRGFARSYNTTTLN